MDSIRAAKFPGDLETVQSLFLAYAQGLGIDLGFQGFDAELAGLPGAYAPPDGRLLLAWQGPDAVGCVALRRHAEGMAEMKRLYVAPAARGSGLGRRLAEAAVAEAVAIGYARVRLDTLSDMLSAQRVYEALGFRTIAPYYDNPVPGTRYMELALDGGMPGKGG